MTTFNIETTIPAGTFHKRSTGKTGQVLASPQMERKLAKVEALFQAYHGVKLGRYKLYDAVLEPTREAKADVGGYIQYTAEAVAGIILDHMHKQLGKAIKRKNKQKPVAVDIGVFQIDNLRDLARGKRGRKSTAA